MSKTTVSIVNSTPLASGTFTTFYYAFPKSCLPNSHAPERRGARRASHATPPPLLDTCTAKTVGALPPQHQGSFILYLHSPFLSPLMLSLSPLHLGAACPHVSVIRQQHGRRDTRQLPCQYPHTTP